MSSEFQDRLIHVALRKGFLDAARVRLALQTLREQRRKGRSVDLSRVLVEEKFLSERQFEEIRGEIAQEGPSVSLGDYEILGRLGRGAMGTVYRARQRSLDRVVALKVLASHLAINDEFVRRFLREARLAAQLNHPHVVQIFDVGEWKGTHYIVMEHVPGRSLEQLMAAGERLAEAEALTLAIQIGKALQLAEARGIVHRDIKPGNILLTADGTAKLADLGLALAPEEDDFENRVGTPYYLSPEQARNDPRLDTRSDIYSLGCTLFHALTGQPPFQGATTVETVRMHVEAPVPDAAALRSDLSPAFSAVLRRMMAKRPEDRFDGPGELVATLEQLQVRRALPTAQRVKPRPSRPVRGRGWLVAALIAVLVVLAVLVLLIAARPRRRPRPPWRRPLDRPAVRERLKVSDEWLNKRLKRPGAP